MTFRNNNSLLFYKGDLSEALRQNSTSISSAVDGLTEQYFLSSSDDVLVDLISQQVCIEPIELMEDLATMTREETKVDVSQNSDRNPFRDRGPIFVAGIKIRVAIPFRGDHQLWDFRPSTWQSTFPQGNVRLDRGKKNEGAVTFVYEFPADESPDRIKGVHERNMEDVRFYLNGQQSQIQSEQAGLEQRIKAAIANRRDRLKRHDNLADVFGIPLKTGDVKPDQQNQLSKATQGYVQKEHGEAHHWDVFISHAWEDKEEIARPLADALISKGLKVWFDEFTLKVGDSLRRSIDKGLAKSRYGIVIISPSFLSKEWPQKELDGLLARESEGHKVILPIWHMADAALLRQHSPLLADRVATNSSSGLEKVVSDLLSAIQ